VPYCGAAVFAADDPAAADDISATAQTEQSAVAVSSTKITKSLKQGVVIKADISPAKEERTVKLQRYNTPKKKWSTISTMTVVSTSNDGHASVKFDVPSDKRDKTTSKWRVYAAKSSHASSAKSKTIKITTRNLSNVSLSAKAACIYRVDGKGSGTLIYTKNSAAKRAQASTTKLMTAILAIDSGKMGKKTTISEHAVATPWGSGKMKAGDQYYNKDLMYAMLMPSSNDAATAVSEMVSGSEAKFVKKMNKKAKEMGLVNTQFRNPHGLDADGHYTTAKELAVLTAEAYTYPLISEIWNTKVKTIKSLRYKRSWTLYSTNAIFGYDSNFKGGKTGTEDNAGCCFAGAYELNGVTYITVVLGSGYGFSRWLDTKKLHSYIKDNAESSY
jgi:D-alanyl-D-alanine carboxypeptidase